MRWIVFSFVFIFFASCLSKREQLIAKENNETEALGNGALSLELLAQIEDLIQLYDDRKSEISTETNMIKMEFRRSNGECFLVLYDMPYYQRKKLKGYEIVNSYMIYYDDNEDELYVNMYNLDEKCNCDLVDFDKLETEPLADYTEIENSDLREGNFDPIGRIYKIHSRDSLELVFEGFI
ncbi:hypothetical protein M2137_000685 [Parabacteroides sp. PFB2-10]|uniref:hypothetical protein n=1 Tax=Parabacteroides sp. PFB2-10 TaxID=1742405 RepID=UPI002474A933|nr:hypothetical protein [Parabacteroides sp. PFB2-10]MDH6311926.1 hypothetical protein [Parabacteroides sp. PFB2-10]